MEASAFQFLPRIPGILPPGARISRGRSTRLRRIGRWHTRARWLLSKLKAVPKPILALGIAAAVVAVFSVTNLVYQILHKPTEVFALIPGESNKAPIETWKQYAPLFREYSTTSISPELLAALAQVESAGNRRRVSRRRLSSREAWALADALPPSEKVGSRRQEPPKGMMPRRSREAQQYRGEFLDDEIEVRRVCPQQVTNRDGE
jgi:hypothetical protein